VTNEVRQKIRDAGNDPGEVGSGALIGYIEHHINAWDCLAGLLVVHEAGGRTNDFIRDNGLHHGGNIVAASPTLYDQLKSFIPSTPPIRR
jgi:myo-inositol-1(or 4)-monophosphatase